MKINSRLSQEEFLEIKLNVLGGKQVISGTRIPVQFIYEFVDQGISIDEILQDYYPHLEKDNLEKIVHNHILNLPIVPKKLMIPPDIDKLLVDSFPIFFKDRYCDEKKTQMSIGFACGVGWVPLIKIVAEKAEIYNKSVDNEESFIIAIQVKEKWGGLRVYINSKNEEITDLINKVNKMSFKTCEYCGQGGKTYTLKNDLLKTLCKYHKRKIKDN